MKKKFREFLDLPCQVRSWWRRRRFKRIKLLICDMDGVLRDSTFWIWQALCATVCELGGTHTPSYQEFCSYYKEPWLVYYRIFGVAGPEEKILEAYIKHLDRLRHNFKLFPETIEFVRQVRKMGYLMAVVSLVNDAPTTEIYTEAGIEGEFNSIVGRAYHKTEAILEACKCAGVQLKEALYLGDLASDMEQAGLAGVWRVAKIYEDVDLLPDAHILTCKADHRVSELQEVVDLVAK